MIWWNFEDLGKVIFDKIKACNSLPFSSIYKLLCAFLPHVYRNESVSLSINVDAIFGGRVVNQALIFICLKCNFREKSLRKVFTHDSRAKAWCLHYLNSTSLRCILEFFMWTYGTMSIFFFLMLSYNWFFFYIVLIFFFLLLLLSVELFFEWIINLSIFI